MKQPLLSFSTMAVFRIQTSLFLQYLIQQFNGFRLRWTRSKGVYDFEILIDQQKARNIFDLPTLTQIFRICTVIFRNSGLFTFQKRKPGPFIRICRDCQKSNIIGCI